MYFDPPYISYIVAIVLLGLVTLPALVLTVLLRLRTPGHDDEPSRKWAKYAKVAFGLFTLSNVVRIVSASMEAENFYVPYEGWTPKYVASRTLGSINIPIEHVGSATVFLSLFYLARAVALLPSDERPIGLSAGQKWARAVFIWVCLASVTSMCLFFSVWAGEVANNDYGTFTDDVSSFYRSIVSTSLRIALYATHIICAICVLVYIAKTRKKLGLSTTSHKASSFMLACGILWLIRVTWVVLYIILTSLVVSPYSGWEGSFMVILDVLLENYLMFVVLVLLYVLATADKDAMSQPQEQEQRTKNTEQVA